MTTSIENDLEELLSCAICLGTLSEPKLLPCSHRFCKPCLVMEMDRSGTRKGLQYYFPCPLCKRGIKLGKGNKGEDWVVNFDTDRLLNAILDLLKEEKEGSKDICLSHRKKLSLVCYSCRITGCYICAWQEHRHCADVKNFQDELKQIKLALVNHLEESRKCIEKIVPCVARWSSSRKSLENQWEYSNRFIERCLHHRHRESDLAFENLIQEYEDYITRTSMSKEIEEEIRRLMKTFPVKINGNINIFDIKSRLQRKNKTIVLPQIKELSKMLESVPDVEMLISIVEKIEQVLNLDKEGFVLKGKDLLKQEAKVLSKPYRDNLFRNVNTNFTTVVQDSLITKPEQIDLGNVKGECLSRALETALRNSRTPKELVENTGRLCFPDEYHTPFDRNAAERKPQKPAKRKPSNARFPEKQLSPFQTPPVNNLRLTSRRRSHATNRQHIQRKRPVACRIYRIEGAALDMTNHEPGLIFCSYNSLCNEGNPEPFPSRVRITTRVIPKPSNIGPLPAVLHHFENTDDKEEGLECARVCLENIGNGLVMETRYSMSYERERFGIIEKVLWVAFLIFILFIILSQQR